MKFLEKEIKTIEDKFKRQFEAIKWEAEKSKKLVFDLNERISILEGKVNSSFSQSSSSATSHQDPPTDF